MWSPQSVGLDEWAGGGAHYMLYTFCLIWTAVINGNILRVGPSWIMYPLTIAVM
jgi:hypothetical protein